MSTEIIVDSFAGGGGASTGIERALGRSPDIAINHDDTALSLHAANHPTTRHIRHDIWSVDPVAVTGGAPVGLMWASPDCKHFSKAKGGVPREKGIRDLAWVVVRWAHEVAPRVIILENVEEFRTWGPLTDAGHPCPARRGETFARFVAELAALGYRVEHRELRACDYGAPTIRRRLFLIARRDGRPIVWPTPTHGAPDSDDVRAGRRLPWRTAADILDWSLPCHSIFLSREEGRAVGVNRPLAAATMARIAKGVQRYVIDAARPFLVPLTHHGDTAQVAPVLSYAQHGGASRRADEPAHTIAASAKDQNQLVAVSLSRQFGTATHGADVGTPIGTVMAGGAGGKTALVAAFLAQHNAGPRPGAPGHEIASPVSTVTVTGAQQAVVAAHLSAYYGAGAGGLDRSASIDEPIRTIVTENRHAIVSAFLAKYYGTGEGQAAGDPLGTVTTRDRFGLVTLAGEAWQIADIGMRMLSPRELFAAQGFPSAYIIDRGHDGRAITKTAQVRMCGNSVCPDVTAALVAANYIPDQPPLVARRRRKAAPAALIGPLFTGAGVVA